MGNVRKVVCDNCGKEVLNRYTEKGWISFEGSLSMSKGEKKNNDWKTFYLENNQWDFCSWSCFQSRVRKERKRR